MPQAAAASSFASTSILVKTTEGNSSCIFSYTGAIILQGPHHVAVKSMMTKGCSKELQKQKSGCRSGGGAACRRSYLRLVFLKSGEYFDHFMHSSLLSRAVAYFQGQHSIRPQLRGRLFPILFAAARKLAARLESPQLRAPLSGVIHQTAHPPQSFLWP